MGLLKKGISITMALAIGFSAAMSTKIVQADKNSSQKNQVVTLGIENIDKYMKLFEGKRVGLITNATGVDSNLKSSVDIMNEKTNLTALFAPEHGIRGAAQDGEKIPGGEIDPVTGLPIYSLYGKTNKPTAEMLENVDTIVFDIQDVGARFYTYVSTMAYAIEAAIENEKDFVVLDRPNPIGGDVEGFKSDAYSFIGLYPTVQEHGMTAGEWALYIFEEFIKPKYEEKGVEIKTNVDVVKLEGWTRNMYYEDTNLPWVQPSPNMPTVDTALVYTGTCVFEGTNVSEGRGTTKPFENIGAPFIKDPFELAKKMNSYGLEGVTFRPTSFKPSFNKFANDNCNGVQLHVTDRDKFDAVKAGLVLMFTIQEMYPEDFEYLDNTKPGVASNIDLRLGIMDFTDRLAKGEFTKEDIINSVEKGGEEFKKETQKYYLYQVKNNGSDKGNGNKNGHNK